VASPLILAFLASIGRGDVLRILHNEQEAIQARVDLVQRARLEIDAAYFAVGDDRVALAFLALLRDASKRGVTVRLLVDGIRNDIPREVQEHLVSEGVEIREFHPINPCRPLEINHRMHDKALIVDGCEMIVGGRNLEEQYFGLARRNYVDRDAYLRGQVAAQAFAHFQRVWSSQEVRPTCQPGESTCAAPSWPQVALNAAVGGLCRAGVIRLDGDRDWGAGRPELPGVCFLGDYCGQKGHPGAIRDVLLDLVSCAQNSIILESPYLVISPDLEGALARAQARGARVTILTNSLASTDQIITYGGYSNQKRKLLARGIQLWEFAGPHHLHAKSALIDGHFAVIGSYNFDPRAERLDTETAVVAWGADVAADLDASMAAHFANAWPIAADGKPVHSPVKHPGASRVSIGKLHGFRLIAPLVKRNL
jgi:phosphatidylserine/phosphatidylglycerophosphate/cardiolipin synthase-like enzyme